MAAQCLLLPLNGGTVFTGTWGDGLYSLQL